ncbi:MAG: 16S rRNA (cytosine(1402)-N(4))-methyltransferase RsmH [Candidatus Bathyarchaeota archaeon]|nr:16S rRNA (cytosine(1402)-N(4))-methyltransferase RsmH [Candidatus Bathyarchaeota archaeon]
MFNLHLPVMKEEVIRFLDPKPDEDFIDCTIGLGGHALAILERNKPNGKVLGIDFDPQIIEELKRCVRGTELEKRLVLVCDNFANLEKVAKTHDFMEVSGVLFDLGLSSWHLEASGRGFSFWRNEPLDMRYNPQSNTLTAEGILNTWSLKDIVRILRVYGEERFARRIAKEIVDSRPLRTTVDLVMAVERATPPWYHRRRIHFATKTFQALRIAVNSELENLERALPQALNVLRSGGKLAVITFHSLEDRVAKNFMRVKAKEGAIKVLTKKPVRPSEKEVKENPRARSAKLRVAVKV